MITEDENAVNTKDSIQRNGCHYAAMNGHFECLRYLVEKGTNINQKAADGTTPLHYACENGNIEVVRYILGCEGVNINERTMNGWRPIHYAAKTGHIEVLKLLLEQNPYFETDGSNSPAALAEANGFPAAMREIKRYVRSGKMPAEDPYFPSKAVQTRDVAVQVPEIEEGKPYKGLTAADLGYDPRRRRHRHKHQRVIESTKKRSKKRGLAEVTGDNNNTKESKEGGKDKDKTKTRTKTRSRTKTKTRTGSKSKTGGSESATSTYEYETRTETGTGEENIYPEGLHTGDVFTYYTYSEFSEEEAKAEAEGTGQKSGTKSTSFVSKHSSSQGTYISESTSKAEEEEEEKKEEIDDSDLVRPTTALKMRFNPNDYAEVIKTIQGLPDINTDKEMQLGQEKPKTGTLTQDHITERSLDNPILDAAKENDPEKVRHAIADHSTLINNADDVGNTALHYAAINNNLSLAEVLVRHGARVNLRNEEQQTPAHIAAINGYSQFYMGLVKLGAKIDITDNKNKTAEEYFQERRKEYQQYMGSCLYGRVKIVERIIKLYPAFINEQDKALMTGLMRAVEGQQLEVIKYLVGQGANLDLKNNKGKSALYLAAEKQYYEIANFLIQNHADVNTKDSDGNTLLYVAIKLADVKLLRMLFDAKIDINLKDGEGYTVIQEAARSKQYDVLNMLLLAGAPSDTIADNGDTLLHILVKNYDNDSKFIVKQLILEGTPCDIQDGNGQTLLHIACIKELRDLIHYLVAKGVRLNVKDTKGKTPFFYANKGDDYVIIKFLADKGAK